MYTRFFWTCVILRLLRTIDPEDLVNVDTHDSWLLHLLHVSFLSRGPRGQEGSYEADQASGGRALMIAPEASGTS